MEFFIMWLVFYVTNFHLVLFLYRDPQGTHYSANESFVYAILTATLMVGFLLLVDWLGWL